jgi:hypothetical protein
MRSTTHPTEWALIGMCLCAWKMRVLADPRFFLPLYRMASTVLGSQKNAWWRHARLWSSIQSKSDVCLSGPAPVIQTLNIARSQELAALRIDVYSRECTYTAMYYVLNLCLIMSYCTCSYWIQLRYSSPYNHTMTASSSLASKRAAGSRGECKRKSWSESKLLVPD